MPHDVQWLTPEQLSDRLQIPIKTLTDWRYRGFGPPFTKFGTARCSRVRYKLADVERWERDAASRMAS